MNFCILGSGKSALSIAKFLKKRNHEVKLSDANRIDESTKEILSAYNIEWEESGHTTGFIFDNTNALVISPGIPLSHHVVIDAVLRNICIMSEIEAVLNYIPKNIKLIGITGTNGKSTATAFLSYLLNQSELFTSIPCGNFGLPLSQALENLLEIPHEGSNSKNLTPALCIELSSYQLETTFSYKFDSVIFLNIQEDHLERYGTLEQYFKAKWRLVMMTHNDSLVVLSSSVYNLAKKFGLPFSKANYCIVCESDNLQIIGAQVSFSKIWPVSIYENSFFYNKVIHHIHPPELSMTSVKFHSSNGCFSLEELENRRQYQLFSSPSILLGKHNHINMAFSALVANYLGVSVEKCLKAINKETSTFKSLPHRLEPIKVAGSVYEFYNDSKATNLSSTIKAIECFEKPLHILIGGQGKNESFLPLLNYINNPIKRLYPFGTEAHKIYSDLIKHTECINPPSLTMLSAAAAAKSYLAPNDILILSPGCSSFDEFKNFEHRGDTFRVWVQNQAWN